MFGYYLENCFWLLVPILLLNALLMRKLPENYQPAVFSFHIPRWTSAGEALLRVAVFAFPLFMPFGISQTEQKIGLLIYLVGFFLYALSWMMQIWFPGSGWSSSRWGFMAPSYTPAIWLLGIAYVGPAFYFAIPHTKVIYMGFSAAFLIFHNAHSWSVFTRAQSSQNSPIKRI